jgi:2-oxoglutarate dehydrogenase E1 component
MSRQALNDALLSTSFLYGANAAYIEDLYARFEKDPKSVDAEWQAFFGALNDDPASVEKSAKGASWQKSHWPIHANGELVSALDGNWGAVEKKIGDKIQKTAQAKGVEVSPADVLRATRDSVRALMMIRAYRMRGHLVIHPDKASFETWYSTAAREQSRRSRPPETGPLARKTN